MGHPRREVLQRRVMGALGQLARYYERRGQGERACAFLLRQLDVAPWQEEAHRHLMCLYAGRGERARAMLQYRHCERILADLLDVAPSVETDALYGEIKRGGRFARPNLRQEAG